MSDILEIYKKLRIEYKEAGQHHHARPGWVQTDCPFCSDKSGKFRLGWNLAGGYYSCWACGIHRRVDTLAHMGRITVREAKELFKDFKKADKLDFPKIHASGRLTNPDGLSFMPRGVHRLFLKERKFVRSRIEDLWKIQYISLNTEGFNWRVYIPIIHEGRTVSWTCRSVKQDAEVRYRSAKPSQEIELHSNLLYGEDYCLGDTIIIHEGPLDVWSTGPGAVCTFGTNFNTAQILKMSRFKRKVVCFDSGPEGQVAAKKLCSLLKDLPGKTINVVLKGKDSSDSDISEVQELRDRFLSPIEIDWRT